MKYNSKNILVDRIRDIIEDIYKLDEIKPFVDEYGNLEEETQEMQKELYGRGTDG